MNYKIFLLHLEFELLNLKLELSLEDFIREQ